MRRTARGALWALALIITLSTLLRLAFTAAGPAQSMDMGIFLRWSELIHERGLTAIYAGTDVNYPPLALYLLAALEWLQGTLPDFARGDAATGVFFKGMTSLADAGITILIAVALRGESTRRRIAACAAYALNPAILYVATFWSQLDGIYTFWIVAAAVLLARKRPNYAWLAFALALMTKPQAVGLLPLLGIGTLRRHGARGLYLGGAVCATAILVLCGPWLASGQGESLLRGISRIEPRIDLSGYNLWYLLLGGNVAGIDSAVHPAGLPLSYAQWAFLLYGGSSLVVSGLLWRQRARALGLGGALVMLGLFLFAPGVHERFLFPAIPFVVLAATGWDGEEGGPERPGREIWVVYALLTATFLFNLTTIASFAPDWWTNVVATQPPYDALMLVLKGLALVSAGVNVLCWLWLLRRLGRFELC